METNIREELEKLIPEIRSPIKEISDLAREQIIDKLAIILSDNIMDDKLKRLIVTSFYRSRAEPGHHVGIEASEGLAGPMTQMTLSGFHQAGSAANISSGIEALKEILNITKKRKAERTTIHFKNRYLLPNEILDLKKEIVGVTVKDLLIQSPRDFLNKEEDSWYEAFKRIFSIESLPPISTRLRLNRNKLFEYEITTYEIIEKIKKQFKEIIAIPSPISGESIYIDVFPTAEVVNKHSKKLSSAGNLEDKMQLFLTQVFKPSLETIVIKGIPGISEIFPETVRVTKMIKNVSRKNDWYIWLDNIKMLYGGIDRERVAEVIEASGIEIVETIKSEKIWIPMGFRVKADENPLELINRRLNEEEEKLRETGVSSDLYRKGNYSFVYANGSNLRKVLTHPLIDPRISICNNILEINSVIGIQAVNNFIIKDVYETITNSSSYCSPKHIVLLANFMTAIGLVPVTSSGVSKHNRGAFTDATFEQTVEAFFNAALIGRWEETSATSTSLFIGERGRYGTGICEVEFDEEGMKALVGEEKETETFKEEVTGAQINPVILEENENDYISEKVMLETSKAMLLEQQSDDESEDVEEIVDEKVMKLIQELANG